MQYLKIIGVALCAFMFTAMINGAQAQDVPPTCEEEYLDVLKERAWMEGKREMELAQRIILKADSVLEYSCFRDRVGDLIGPGSEWSDGKPWQRDLGNVPGGNMQNAANLLILQPLNRYLGSNFSHSYGGGTYSGGSSACNGMYMVWDFLKCHDFNKNNFKTFQELVGSDPRDKPTPCNESGRQQKWQDALNAAYPPPADPAVPGGMDKKITYIDEMWGGCAGARPIPTGISVASGGAYGDYEEHVCLPPGCSYNGTACQ